MNLNFRPTRPSPNRDAPLVAALSNSFCSQYHGAACSLFCIRVEFITSPVVDDEPRSDEGVGEELTSDEAAKTLSYFDGMGRIEHNPSITIHQLHQIVSPQYTWQI